MSSVLLITGGGSGGHTSAAASIIQYLLNSENKPIIVWVTSRNGIEVKVAKRLGIIQIGITVGKLNRSISLKTLLDLIKVPIGIFEAALVLRKIKPTLIFSTGGYVAIPIVIAAALYRIPIIIHEQTISVGLANKISSLFAREILVSYEESMKFFDMKKCIVTGPPVRPEIFIGDREKAIISLEFQESLPTIYVTGGAQGAEAINYVVGKALPELLKHFQIIHQCGTISSEYGKEWLIQQTNYLPENLKKRYAVKSYIADEIGDIFKLADILITRTGAAITAEICALNIPSIVIPYAYSINNEQVLHAKLLEKQGLAKILYEKDMTPESLTESALLLLKKPSNQKTNQNHKIFLKATEIIAKEIMSNMNPDDKDKAKNKKKPNSQSPDKIEVTGICPSCKTEAAMTIIDDENDGVVWAQCHNCGYMYRCG